VFTAVLFCRAVLSRVYAAAPWLCCFTVLCHCALHTAAVLHCVLHLLHAAAALRHAALTRRPQLGCSVGASGIVQKKSPLARPPPPAPSPPTPPAPQTPVPQPTVFSSPMAVRHPWLKPFSSHSLTNAPTHQIGKPGGGPTHCKGSRGHSGPLEISERSIIDVTIFKSKAGAVCG
jgi:hypothetical protein